MYNVTISSGMTNASFYIPFTDNDILENNKSFNFTIHPSLPIIVTVDDPDHAILIIIDDDGKIR